MSITVKFFARLREETGISETEIAHLTETKVCDIWQRVVNKSMPGDVMVAVNHVYADPETTIQDQDEVAFFPPVTGG